MLCTVADHSVTRHMNRREHCTLVLHTCKLGVFYNIFFALNVGWVAQTVQRLATGWIVRGSKKKIPVGARFFTPVQTGPGAHPASCTMGTGSLPGVKSGRGVTLTRHPLLVPWSMFLTVASLHSPRDACGSPSFVRHSRS